MGELVHWLPVVMVVAGMVATWGGFRVRFRLLERSQRDQGRRIGALELAAAKAEGFEEAAAGKARRRPSQLIPVQPTTDDDSGPEAA